MTKKIKYKQLIRKLQRHADDDVVIVADQGSVLFYTEDEMTCIARLVEYINREGKYKTTFY